MPHLRELDAICAHAARAHHIRPFIYAGHCWLKGVPDLGLTFGSRMACTKVVCPHVVIAAAPVRNACKTYANIMMGILRFQNLYANYDVDEVDSM